MKAQLIEQIQSYTHNCPENWYAAIDGRFFDDPVIRVADAADPLFEQYKTLIGPFHNTPKEAYERIFGADTFPAGSVISVMLPTATAIRESNRKQTEWASKEWAIARAHNDALYAAIGKYVVEQLATQGYHSTAPSFADGYKIISDGEHFASTWSERHIAYVAGHGTFGLNDGFISDRGITVKFVSVVTDLVLEADARTASGYTANCLYLQNGTCGACMKRCPIGAITKDGHDKKTCYQRCYGKESQELAVSYGGNAKSGAGCALCQTGVPCEFRNPALKHSLY